MRGRDMGSVSSGAAAIAVSMAVKSQSDPSLSMKVDLGGPSCTCRTGGLSKRAAIGDLPML